jgi:DNA repair protein RadA/Sms
MIVAILTSHLKLKLHEKEIYLNVAGGVKTNDPSVDLPVIISIFSAVFEIPIKSTLLSFGEISLSGEIRPVQFMEARIKEAVKLGYTNILCPPLQPEMKHLLKLGEIIEMRDIKALRHIIK